LSPDANGDYVPAAFSREERMRAVAASCALIALLAPIPAWADLNMRPGLWQSIMTVGGNEMPPDQKCYLQKDVEALDRFQRGGEPQGRNPCTASGYRAFGNTMSYTLTCVMQGQKSVSAVTMNYDGDRITGEITAIDGTTSRLVNTRTGDCSESSFGK
jgi:uncharacterized protein DUF3617